MWLNKEGLAYTEKTVQGRKSLVPLDPQPLPEIIITVHRYYTSLKSNDNYKKRVSWFSDLPENLQHRQFITLVEYQGSLKENSASKPMAI